MKTPLALTFHIKMNNSYIRRLKNARKNAQREIDKSNLSNENFQCRNRICLKHSYPLWVICDDLVEFDYVISSLSAKKYKSFSRVARAIFKKGKIVTCWELVRLNLSQESDLRKINGSTYNMTNILYNYRKFERKLMKNSRVCEKLLKSYKEGDFGFV